MTGSKVQGFSGFWVLRFPTTQKLEPLDVKHDETHMFRKPKVGGTSPAAPEKRHTQLHS